MTDTSKQPRRTIWILRLLASAAVSAFIVAILLRQLPTSQGEQTASLFTVLRAIVWPWLGIYLVLQLGQTLLRAVRYGVLLRAAGERDVPNLFHLTLVTMTRNMFVDLVPARAGELIYIALLNRGYKLSGQACLSSLAVSFIFDFIALGLIFLTLLLVHLATAAWNPLIAVAALLFLIFPGLALTALYCAPRPLLRRAESFLARSPAFRRNDKSASAGATVPAKAGTINRAIERIVGFLERVVTAIETTRASKTFARTLLLSFGVRLCKYVGLYATFRAVTEVSFPDFAAASPLHVLTALLSSEAAASLPLPTLMSFGTYEAGGSAAWELLGFPIASAAIVTLAFHICSQIVDYSLGGLGMLLFTLVGGRRGPIHERPARSPSPAHIWLKIAFACAVVLACAAFAAWQYRSFKKLGSLKPPKSGHEIKSDPASAEALTKILEGRRGIAVWSSARAGTHDIWLLQIPENKLRQLTHEAHTDYFPRISPDGSRVLFSRSRELWVPQRNEVPWDTWMLDLQTGTERRIAKFATVATWLDNETILFQRQGTQVVSRVLADGTETILFQSGRGTIPGGTLLETPSLNPRVKQLVSTFRGTTRTTALIDQQSKYRPIDNGCQHHWTPDGSKILGVAYGGIMKNALYFIDPATLKPTLLFDSPNDWSHEYFPKLSNDGKFLVYGASQGAHEHDTADYEIFLWRLGTPMENAARLTWHTGNDNWPDLWIAP